MQFELKLAEGQFVVWEGETPEEAAHRYVDHARVMGRPDVTVVAWRHYPRHGVFVWGGRPIVGPDGKPA